jgi:hypothetical protein
MPQLARPITKDEIATYNHAGVVLLRGILTLPAVNALAEASTRRYERFHKARAAMISAL